MKLLEGKVAIVTGAARGIGKAIALKLASEGANIAFTDLNIDDNALNTQKELEAFGVKAKGYASNAANFDETHAVVDEIVKDFGRVDVLVNNAGITKDGLMMRMSEAQWDAVINVNLKSAFNFVHACTPIMMKQKSGSIINMSSVNGTLAIPSIASYNVSKGGINQLTRVMALALAEKGIRVNAVAPGTIATELASKAVLTSESARQRILSRTPLGRLGHPSEVADTVAYLASDAASYITGEIVVVDGGRMTLNYTMT